MNLRTYQLGINGTNCYLAWDEKSKDAILVDPGDYGKEVTDFIKSEELNLHYIVLTHGHSDHIAGVKQFMKDFPIAKLVASNEERDILRNAESNFSSMMAGESIELDADIYVKDGDKLLAGTLVLEILSTPGHTPGGMSILIDDTLFSGDSLFRQSIGRTDLVGGNYDLLIENVKNKLMTLPDETKVYPGHMGPTTIGHEKKHNPFI